MKPGTKYPKKRLATREGTRITTIALPEELHRRAYIAAFDAKMTLAELLRTALVEYLKKHPSRKE